MSVVGMCMYLVGGAYGTEEEIEGAPCNEEAAQVEEGLRRVSHRYTAEL